MKKIIIATIIAICLSLGFYRGGLGDVQSASSEQKQTIENTLVSEINSNTIAFGDSNSQGDTIFSWPTILFLSGGVLGIVAFRRNTL